jgi:nickel/cobalt transporter (NiCoT) family protein
MHDDVESRTARWLDWREEAISSRALKQRIAAIYVLLLGCNVAAWALAFALFRTHSLILGTALLAYMFGLRHAVDADHISAIDNVTRKLMQVGKRPVSVGLFFSLGHSTVVILLCVSIAVGANAVRMHLPALQSNGELIGTIVSAVFLLLIAVINIGVLLDILRGFDRAHEQQSRGLMTMLFRRVIALVDASWKMYPIGFLFGLGFDTATEVGLLGIAAVEAGKGLPVADIMIFPVLFTAGMSLLDTTDGILMLGAYGWAFIKPARKLYYNLTVTIVSIFAALLVGSIESLGLIASRLQTGGNIWSWFDAINRRLDVLGVAIIAIFAAGWVVSAILHRMKAGEALPANAEL